jgi:hypothetical protein
MVEVLATQEHVGSRASASFEATNCDHIASRGTNQGFFYSLNAAHKAPRKRAAIVRSSERSERL